MKKLLTLTGSVLGLLVLVSCGPTEPGGEAAPTGEASARQPLDEVCTRVEATLLALKTTSGARVCSFDEDCPWGSFCNQSTLKCDWQCLENGSGANACSVAGTTCGCDGRCSVPGSEAPSEVSRPNLGVEPTYLTFTPPTAPVTVWKEQSADVSLTVDTAAQGTAAATRQVRVSAGPEVEVSCSSASGPFASECTLTGWTFTARGTRFQATKRVWGRPTSGSTRTTWNLQFDGEGLTPRRAQISAARATTAPTTSGTVRFEGSVTVRVLSTATSTSTEGSPETRMTLPVQAWVNNDYLLLYDASRVLSPSGKLRVERVQPYVEFSWLPSTTASGDRTTVDALTAVLSGRTFSGLPSGARSLSGRFDITFTSYGSSFLNAQYALSRSRDAAVACSASAPCASGYVCEQGLQACVPGTAWTTLGNNYYPRNTVVHEQFKAWRDSGAQQLDAAPTAYALSPERVAQGVLCDTGSGQPPNASFTSTVLTYSGELACSTGRPTYFARLNTQRDLAAVLPSSPVLESRQMLQSCVSDLQQMPAGPYSSTLDTFFAQRLQNPGQCFSVPRTFDALSLLGTKRQTSRDRLRWYLLQQWIGAHAFVARQTMLHGKSYDYIGDTPQVQLPTMSNSLDQFERAWELYLTPEMGVSSLDYGVDGFCEFKNPDYRLPSNPVGVWTYDDGEFVQSRNFYWDIAAGGGDLTFLWYPEPTKQDACSEHVAEQCGMDPSYCPPHPSRCGIGIYPILAFGEGVNGDSGNKFYVYKYAAEYMTMPDEALVVEHASGGARHFASYDLDWMNNRPLNVPVVARRRGGQYSFFDGNVPNGPIAPPADNIDMPDYFVPFIEDEPLPVGDPVESTTGIVVFDYAMSDEAMRAAAAKPYSSWLNVAAERLPMPGNLPHHEQGMGLPTAVLEGVTANLDLLDAELARVARISTCQDTAAGSVRALALERYGRVMRQALTLEASASRQMSVVASMDCVGNPQMAGGVEARFKQARARLEAARGRVQRTLQAMTSCEAMNIPENEAPLLFRSVSGASERFFASSDYVKSYSDLALASAEADVNAARTAWEQQRTSNIQQQMTEQDAQRRLERLQAEYGRPLVEMCGLTVESKDALALFDPAQPNAIKPENCYVAKQTPECTVSPTEMYSAVTTEQARYSMCIWADLRGSGEITLTAPFSNVVDNYTTATVSNGVISVNGHQFETRYLYQPPFSMDRVSTQRLATAQQMCALATGGMRELPSPIDLGKGLSNTCYRGELGVARLKITAAAQSMQVARSTWADAQERYNIATNKCINLIYNEAQKAAVRNAHDAAMLELTGAKETADRLNQGLNSFNRALSTAEQGAMIGTSFGGPVGGVIGGVIGFGLGLFGAHAADESIRLQQEIYVTELHFQQQMNLLDLDIRVKNCLSDASLSMQGVKTAALQVARATTDVELATLDMRNMQTRVTQLSTEGVAAVKREQGRTVESLAHHYWLDERIEKANDSFEWARRLTYLLALSLEYEMQRSLSERQTILSATRPSQLRSVYNNLVALKFAAKVGNRFPGEDTVFLSLRDDVLKLSAMTGAPSGERDYSPGQRFARRISSPQQAVFDRTGHYLGQGITFNMPVPNGLANRCAERLWSVRANMVTDGSGTWPQEQGAQVLLYKRNTFQSRWCSSLGLGDGTDFQVRVHSPSVDLSGQPPLADAASTSAWSSASIQSRINADSSAWYGLACTSQNGCTDELAGRGFFGEYMLLLPEVGLLGSGFDASSVEDVMLAFEVESVSNAPDPGLLREEECGSIQTEPLSCAR
ncbi:hypothetical protein LY474_40595 [Myxococcus stipitatus]|uniref:hypothetical protein n=1 Tax=Myxococcus stipitatus TaxID=83455 RepID=UPI001F472CC3|nr:hypothetical protein [Myxococcus stipitatus]MCE9674108.1 hypothetical protein [Myxococcus stipitatus]